MTEETPLADPGKFGFPGCSRCGKVTIAMTDRCPWCGHTEGQP